jgi:hypothetical protein
MSCHTCNGTGIEETVDWVPYGSTEVPLHQHWTCSGCLEKLFCPDCDTSLVSHQPEEDEPYVWRCPECGREWWQNSMEENK